MTRSTARAALGLVHGGLTIEIIRAFFDVYAARIDPVVMLRQD